MFRSRHVGERGRTRLLKFIGLSLLLVVVACGLYALYTVRRQQNTQKLLARAREATVAENWDEAVIAYRQYLQRQSEDLEALRAYADVLLERMKTAPEAIGDALRTLRRLVGIEPDNAAAVGKLTRLYLTLREYRQAEELAAGWVTLEPSSADAALALAFAQNRLHKDADAADTLRAAIARNADEPRFYASLVRLLADELNRPEEAARRLEEALRVGPDVPDVHLAAFVFYRRQGDPDDAEDHLQQALRLAPESLDILLPAARYYLSLGRLDEADALLKRAALTAPESRSVLSLRARWAARTGDTAALVAAADELMNRAADDDLRFVARAAELYLQAGKLDRTDECLAKLESLPHAHERLGARLDVLKGARAVKAGDFYSAIEYFRPALRREPRNARTVRLLAEAYAKTGDLTAAADAYQRLMLLAPRDAGARLRFAELAWRQGRLAEVRDAVNGLPAADDQQRGHIELIKLACELREDRAAGRSLADREGLSDEGERLASMAPPDTASARWLMRCLVLIGRPQQAIDLLNQRLTDANAGPGLGAELGQLLLANGLSDWALALSEVLMGRFPDAAEGQVLRVRGLGSSGRLSEAAAYVDRCDLPGAARARVLEALADEYLAVNRTEPALGLLRQAADLVSSNLSARKKLVRFTQDIAEALKRSEEIRSLEGDAGLRWKYELAGALLRLDPSEESLARSRELLGQCILDRPRWPSARLMLGYAHELSGALEEATEAYQTAIAQQPALRTRRVAIRLIGLLKRLGRFAEADVLLDSVAAAHPDEPDVLRLRMQQQIRQRDFDSAVATAERLLHIQPGDPAWAAATADLYVRVGDAVRAEVIARKALAGLPHSTAVLWSLARALIAQGRLDDALAEVREALANANDAAHYLLLARVLARLGRESEATEAIAQSQRLGPDDANVWAACADYWGSLGERRSQLACARKAVELRGRDTAKSLELARLLAESDSIEEQGEAAKIVRRRLEVDPDDAPTLVLEARLALSGKPPDFARAKASLKRALAIDFRSADAHRLLAGVYLRSGDLEAAADALATGLAFAPDDAGLLFGAAEIHCHRAEYDRAISRLLHLLELKPRMLRALRLLATAYQQTGQVDRAIALVEGLAPPDSLSAGETLVLARLYDANEDFKRAEMLFLRALRLDPDSSETFQSVLQFYARRKDFQRVHALAGERRAEYPDDVTSLAVAGQFLGAQCPDPTLQKAGMDWLEQIAREHPDQAADAMFRSGACYYQNGRMREAEGKFQQALRSAPNVPRAVNALAWLYAVDMERPKKARAIIEQFVEAGGREDPALMDTHGTVLLRLGELGAARRKLEQCLKLVGQTPTRTAANYHLGLVLRESGRSREAIPYFRKALRLVDQFGGLTDEERDKAQRLVAEPASTQKARAP